MKKTVRKFKETIELRSSLMSRIRGSRNFNLSAVAFLILIVCCFHIWQRVTVTELVQEVGSLEKTNDFLNDDLSKLSSEIAALSLSSRIERYALDTLGMLPIRAEQLYTLVPERSKKGKPDDLASLAQAIRRVADYMPTITESRVNARDLQLLTIDSTGEGGR